MKLGVYGCAIVLLTHAACLGAREEFDRSVYKGTIFEAAARGEQKKIRSLIVKDGVNPNEKDGYGNAPLHYAKDVETVKTLLDLGADIDIQNKNGITRLHMEVVQGHLGLVKFLLNRGANVNARDNKGVTPLHCATVISYFERPSQGEALAAFLVTWTFYVSLEVYGIMALMIGGAVLEAAAPIVYGTAAVSASILTAVAAVDIGIRNEILISLLEHGASVNARDDNDNTPLHTLAAGDLLAIGQRHGGVFMANNLISAGARLTIKNRFGETPYDVAKRYDRTLLLPLLKPREGRLRVKASPAYPKYRAN